MYMNSGNFNIGVIGSPKLADDTNIEAFLVANELPIKTFDALEKFDAQLKNDAFKTTAVSIFVHELTITMVHDFNHDSTFIVSNHKFRLRYK